MDDFPGLLTRDFGLKPQGKSAPMASQRSSSVRSSGLGSNSYFSPQSAPIFDDNDHGGGDDKLFSDVFKYSDQQPKGTGTWTGSSTTATSSSFDYESMFKERNSKPSSLPVFDKPIYDEDIFDGLPGIKNSAHETSSTGGSSFPRFNSEFASSPKASAAQSKSAAFDDLLEGFQKKETVEQSKRSPEKNAPPLFDDLLSGFSHNNRSAEPNQSSKPFNDLGRTSSGHVDDPFANLNQSPDTIDSSSGFFADPVNNDSFKSEKPGPTFDDLDSLANIVRPAPKAPSGSTNKGKFRNPPVETDTFPSFETLNKPKFDSNLHDLGGSEPETPFSSSFRSTGKHEDSVEDVWLTVSEVPLLTEPTKAPPPSRPAPPRPPRVSRLAAERKPPTDSFTTSTVPTYSNVEDLDDYSMGSTRPSEYKENPSEAAASAAAMKEAMGMAEATFRQMRERDYPIPTRTKEPSQAELERIEQEKQREREKEREREEEREREAQLRLEKEREERERGRQAVERATREARERAAVEARVKAEKAAVEKAANEARQRAARAAVQRVQAEARERAAAEAKEKAEKEARERAEAEEAKRRAKVEAETRLRNERERAEAEEAKRRNDRAAVERAAAEARQRAAAAAAAAMAAKASQQRNENTHKDENDLESFFTSRASSAPKPRASVSDPFFEKSWPETNVKPPTTTTTTTANMRKASSTTNIVDDLSSIFGGPPTSGEFQEVEGETEERRRARLERHQRTQERAAKALAEKNERDLQREREQAERHRIAETIDMEIKRWAAGKEGNLRALLSTLQYALWPECGWQPVSLTDLITAAAVKKVYRKATLCIHPDKVQQKGATLQQKYIAEKVFDLLKEAWNKFNSEELF